MLYLGIQERIRWSLGLQSVRPASRQSQHGYAPRATRALQPPGVSAATARERFAPILGSPTGPLTLDGMVSCPGATASVGARRRSGRAPSSWRFGASRRRSYATDRSGHVPDGPARKRPRGRPPPRLDRERSAGSIGRPPARTGETVTRRPGHRHGRTVPAGHAPVSARPRQPQHRRPHRELLAPMCDVEMCSGQRPVTTPYLQPRHFLRTAVPLLRWRSLEPSAQAPEVGQQLHVPFRTAADGRERHGRSRRSTATTHEGPLGDFRHPTREISWRQAQQRFESAEQTPIWKSASDCCWRPSCDVED